MSDARFKQHRRLTPAQRDLVANHLWLAAVAAKRFARRLPELYDDLYSEGCKALCYKAPEYDPALGVRFATFAQHRVKGAIQDYLRDLLPKGHRRDPDAPSTYSLSQVPSFVAAKYHPGGRDPFDDRRDCVALDRTLAADDEGPGPGLEYQDELAAIFRGLPPREGAMMRAYYGEAGMDMKRVAARFGIHESRFSQIHSRCLELVRGRLGATGDQRQEDVA